MTTAQIALVKVAPVPVTANMTDRQREAWDLIASTPGGVTADEIGARIHAHSEDERCDWCATSGREVATSKALKPLVVKRRGSNRYEVRNPAHRAGAEPVELAGESFEEIFGEIA